MMKSAAFIATALSLFCNSVIAEVLDSADQGFTVRHNISVQQPIKRAYHALTAEIGQWWDPEHTYSGAASNLSIDTRAGGCFCERWSGGEVQHLQVVFATPPERLRLSGGLGPLQNEAVAGTMDWHLESQLTEAGISTTQITMHYRVNGYRAGGMAGWGPGVDQMLGGQIQRLQQYLAHSPNP